MNDARNRFAPVVAAAALLLVSLTSIASDGSNLSLKISPTASGSNVDLIRTMEGGNFSTVAVDGDVLYTGLREFLVAIDVSDKFNPLRISNLLFSRSVNDVAVLGGYAYVANDSAGVRVINITDPTALVEVGADTSGAGRAQFITVSGDYAYVSHGYVVEGPNFHILDISNPANPFTVGSIDTAGWATNVAVQGDFAFLIDFKPDERMIVVDVSNPASPFVVGVWDKPASWGYLDGLDVSGSYVYVAGQGDISGLWVVDVSDPAHPTEAAQVPLADCSHVCVDGNYAHVTTETGLEIVDISVPTIPVHIGSALEGYGDDVVVLGDHAFTGGSADGAAIIDVRTKSNPFEVGRFRAVGPPKSVEVRDSLVCMRNYEGFSMVDVSDPAEPVALGRLPAALNVETMDLAISGDYVYVANLDSWTNYWGGVLVIDISDRLNPVLAGMSLRDGLTSIAVSGGYAFAGGASAFLWDTFVVYDLAIPAQPSEVASYATGEMIFALEMAGSYACLANGSDDLRIMDISNPLVPTEAGTYAFPGSAWDVAVGGSYAYVACQSSPADTSLRVIDISSPSTPVEIGSYATGVNATNVSLYKDHVHLTLADGELHIVDVSDPTTPTAVGINDGGTAGRAAAVPPYIYAASSRHPGYEILEFDSTATGISNAPVQSFVLYQNYPNPFNPSTTLSFVLHRPSAVTLTIYDVTGRRIATVIDETMPDGPHHVTWGGTDVGGNSVSSGVYFYRLKAGNKTMTRKMVLLK